MSVLAEINRIKEEYANEKEKELQEMMIYMITSYKYQQGIGKTNISIEPENPNSFFDSACLQRFLDYLNGNRIYYFKRSYHWHEDDDSGIAPFEYVDAKTTCSKIVFDVRTADQIANDISSEILTILHKNPEKERININVADLFKFTDTTRLTPKDIRLLKPSIEAVLGEFKVCTEFSPRTVIGKTFEFSNEDITYYYICFVFKNLKTKKRKTFD